MKMRRSLTVMLNRKKTNSPLTGLMKAGLIFSLVCFSIIPQNIFAESVGNWNFNGVLTGTPGSHSTASAASLGSTIPTGAFNGSTVYFGEDGWPTGALDANAYVQFSLTPNSGYTLSITSLLMNIRRSTTGASGSGPNNWALRSSLDGYTSNISSGVLTTSPTPGATVVLPAAFTGLTSTVSFRLYGYNATVSSGGGLNRFVFDNITASGSIILPVIIDDFKSVQI